MDDMPTSPLPQPVRVFIIDDHPMFANVVAEIIRALEGFEVVGVAMSGKAATEMLSDKIVDIMLVDLMLPDLGGLELIHRIRKTHSHARILVCSGLDTPESIEMAFRCGAYAFVKKSGRVEDLIATLKAVAAGKTLLDEEVATILRKAVASSRSLKSLTAVDLVILRRLAEGVDPKDVALETGVSLSGIYKSRSRIFQRCGLVDKKNLHGTAARLGLVASSDINTIR